MLFTRLILLFLLVTAFPNLARSQEYDAELSQRLADYGRLSREWKIDSLLDYIDPALYEIVPRETMQATFESMLADENMKIRFKDFSIDRIGEVISLKGTEYCPVNYHVTMSMKMLSEDYRDAGFMKLLASGIGGKTSIDHETYTVSSTKQKLLFALRHAPGAPWYFIEYEADNTAMFDLLVPPAVRDSLKLK